MTKYFKENILFEVILVVIIISLAGIFRFSNLAQNPGWYSDEGTLINIAENYQNNRIGYMVFNQSTLLAARLPLFPTLLGILFQWFGKGMEVLRFFTTSLNVLSVGLLFAIVRNILPREKKLLSLLSALMLAIYPSAVLYSRLGFSYNLLTPMVLMVFWGLWKYFQNQKPVYLIIASLGIGIGILVDLMIISLIPIFILIVLIKNFRDSAWSIPLVLLPFAIYAIIMLVQAQEAFLFDFIFTFQRVGSLPVYSQLSAAAMNYSGVLLRDTWWILAIIGFFITDSKQLRLFGIIFIMTPVFFLGRSLGIGSALGKYYLIPLFPIVSIGVAAFVITAAKQIYRAANEGYEWFWGAVEKLHKFQTSKWFRSWINNLFSFLFIFVILISPFFLSILITVSDIWEGYKTQIDGVMVNPEDVLKVAEVIKSNRENSELIIASPAVAWIFDGQIADFQMAVAATGTATIHFPDDIPSNRFDYDPTLQNARFVIIDPIWRNWAAVNMPEVNCLMRAAESWPLFIKSGEIEVYENPSW